MSEILRRKIPPEYYKQHFSQITFKTSFKNCVYMALKHRQWKQLQQPQNIDNTPNKVSDKGQWTLQWCEKQRVNDVFQDGISSNQRVNHFRLYTQLCRKDMLMKNVRRYKYQLRKKRELVEEKWDFLPPTYFLPSEYIMFAEQFKKSGGLWILKPTGRCQGSGIFLVDKLAQVAPYRTKPNQQNVNPQNPPINKKKNQQKQKQESDKQEENVGGETEENPVNNETYLIQKYIDKPLLFGMKKFDIRIYVLCTDYRDLTVWLYRNGFARFTHEPYSNQDIDNLGGHLTNVQIQKHCDNYDIIRGGKWLLNEFKLYLMSRFEIQKVNKCFYAIQQIIINSLKAVQSKLLPSKSSFQLYGYDFMFDQNLKPWLIQVNGGPSMSANTEFDCRLKCGLVDDTLTIIDLQGLLAGNEMTVGGFDLIMSKGLQVKQIRQCQHKTSLGCKNQRKKVYNKIMRKILSKQRQKKPEQLAEKKEIDKQKKKNKLPVFYQERKKKIIDQQVIAFLKNQLSILEFNQKNQQREEFRPLTDKKYA